MANVNKVILIGRLTRDPEVRTFSNGGKVAAFGFAVNNRKKNQASGEWEDDPVFLDVKAFNRGEQGRQLATQAEGSLRKGQQIFIEGHLVMEQWEDKQSGQKRSKLVVVVDNFQYLEPRQDGGGSGGGRFQKAAPQNKPAAAPAEDYGHDETPVGGADEPHDDIPF
jgi:single-strand DNA-binding protein